MKSDTGAVKSLEHSARVRGCNELRLSVDKSVDAADVGVCATTPETEAQRCSSRRKATSALMAQVPRPAVSVLLPTPISELPEREHPGRAARVAHQPRPHPHFSLLHDLCHGLLGGKAP